MKQWRATCRPIGGEATILPRVYDPLLGGASRGGDPRDSSIVGPLGTTVDPRTCSCGQIRERRARGAFLWNLNSVRSRPVFFSSLSFLLSSSFFFSSLNERIVSVTPSVRLEREKFDPSGIPRFLLLHCFCIHLSQNFDIFRIPSSEMMIRVR